MSWFMMRPHFCHFSEIVYQPQLVFVTWDLVEMERCFSFIHLSFAVIPDVILLIYCFFLNRLILTTFIIFFIGFHSLSDVLFEDSEGLLGYFFLKEVVSNDVLN